MRRSTAIARRIHRGAGISERLALKLQARCAVGDDLAVDAVPRRRHSGNNGDGGLPLPRLPRL